MTSLWPFPESTGSREGIGVGSSQVCVKLVHSWRLPPQVVPVKSPSRKDFLKGVKWTLSHFRVLASGSGCALVQLQPLTGELALQPHLTTVFGWQREVVFLVAAWGAFDGL